jgi:hypothetical protein
MSELYKGSQPGPWRAGEPFSAETPAPLAESKLSEKVMTQAEWASLSAESRHKLNLLFANPGQPKETDEQNALVIHKMFAMAHKVEWGQAMSLEYVAGLKLVSAFIASIRAESSAALQADKDHLLALVAVLREEAAMAERRIAELEKALHDLLEAWAGDKGAK